jgi:hypothetical protein
LLLAMLLAVNGTAASVALCLCPNNEIDAGLFPAAAHSPVNAIEACNHSIDLTRTDPPYQ